MAHTELDLREGRAIEDMVNAKMPVPEIADRLGCAPSTVYRELKRNFWANDAFPKKYAGYFGHAAQLQTNKRRSVQQIPLPPPSGAKGLGCFHERVARRGAARHRIGL